ncbi:hypothetical protein [Bacillus weihaiensis]|nr:hypothetical protein [Bacillus weihaiensis]
MTLFWINHRPHIAVANGFKEISMLEANDLNQRNEIKRNEEIYYD